jgi:hypothetical protein
MEVLLVFLTIQWMAFGLRKIGARISPSGFLESQMHPIQIEESHPAKQIGVFFVDWNQAPPSIDQFGLPVTELAQAKARNRYSLNTGTG